MLQNKIKNSDLSDEDKANLNNILENGDQEFVEEYLKDVKMHNLSANLPTDKICEMFYADGNARLIAEHFNCDVKTIYKHLKNSGWESYRTKDNPRHRETRGKTWTCNGWIWYPKFGLALELNKKNFWWAYPEHPEFDPSKRLLAQEETEDSQESKPEVQNTAHKFLSTQEICAEFEQGKIVSEIAKKYDCTNASIRNHLKKGGYMFDQSKNVWTKEGKESAVRKNENVWTKEGKESAVKKNVGTFRRLVNYLIEGFNTGTIQTNQIITVEMIAKQFNISREAASNVLSYASEKEVLGLRRIGKGVYQIAHQKIQSEVARVQHVQHAVPVVRESVIVEEKIDDDLNNLLRVSKFAKEMGGLNKLKDLCEILLKI